MEPFNILNKDLPQSGVLLGKLDASSDTLELGSLRVFRDGSSILMIFTQFANRSSANFVTSINQIKTIILQSNVVLCVYDEFKFSVAKLW